MSYYCYTHTHTHRSFFCSVVVALATNIRQHFDRNRYLATTGDSSGRVSECGSGRTTVAGPQVNPPCLHHPSENACRFHREAAHAALTCSLTTHTTRSLTAPVEEWRSGHTDTDDREKECVSECVSESEEHIPYYSTHYVPPTATVKKKKSSKLTHSLIAATDGSTVLYCTCRGGECVLLTPLTRNKQNPTVRKECSKGVSEGVSDDLHSCTSSLTSSSSAFTSVSASVSGTTFTPLPSKNQASTLCEWDSSHNTTPSLLVRPLALRSCDDSSGTELLEGTLDQWLCEDFADTPPLPHDAFSTARVRTPTSPTPLETIEPGNNTHSLTHSLTHALTHSLTHSLTYTCDCRFVFSVRGLGERCHYCWYY